MHIGQFMHGSAGVYESFSVLDPEDVNGEATNDSEQILQHSPPGEAFPSQIGAGVPCLGELLNRIGDHDHSFALLRTTRFRT